RLGRFCLPRISKETVLPVDYPCRSICWTNFKPTEDPTVFTAGLLLCLFEQGPTTFQIDENAGRKIATTCDVITNLPKSTFLYHPLICINVRRLSFLAMRYIADLQQIIRRCCESVAVGPAQLVLDRRNANP